MSASDNYNTTQILALATSLAKTPSITECQADETEILESKIAAIEAVSKNVDTLMKETETGVSGTATTKKQDTNKTKKDVKEAKKQKKKKRG